MPLANAVGLALIAFVIGTTLILLAVLGYRVSIRMKISKIFSISVKIRKNNH